MPLEDPGDGTEQESQGVANPKEPAAEPQAAPARPHSRRLLSLAAECGIDEAEAATYTPSELLGVIQAIQHQESRKPAPAPKAPEPEPEDRIDWGTDEEGRPVAEKDLHPGLVKVTKEERANRKKLEKELADLKAWREEQRARDAEAQKAFEQRRVNESHWDAMDKLFRSKPDIFGKATWRTLEPDSEDNNERQRCARVMQGQPGTLEEKFNEAVDILYGIKKTKKAKPQPEPEPEEEEAAAIDVHAPVHDELQSDRVRWRKSGGTAPPSDRRAPEIPEAPEKKAKRAIRDTMRKHGITANGATEESDEDLLPD